MFVSGLGRTWRVTHPSQVAGFLGFCLTPCQAFNSRPRNPWIPGRPVFVLENRQGSDQHSLCRVDRQSPRPCPFQPRPLSQRSSVAHDIDQRLIPGTGITAQPIANFMHPDPRVQARLGLPVDAPSTSRRPGQFRRTETVETRSDIINVEPRPRNRFPSGWLRLGVSAPLRMPRAACRVGRSDQRRCYTVHPRSEPCRPRDRAEPAAWFPAPVPEPGRRGQVRET